MAAPDRWGVRCLATLSQNRRRRYNDTSVAQDIFDGIIEQAIAHGLVDGTVLYTDSTHLKANANKHRYASFRGLIAVACQCLLAATVQDIKKTALTLAKTASAPA